MVSREICESAPICGKEAAEEETDDTGEMGEFRSKSYTNPVYEHL